MSAVTDSAGDELLVTKTAPGRLSAYSHAATIVAGANGVAFSLALHRTCAVYVDTTAATGTLTVFLDVRTPAGNWLSVTGGTALLTVTATGSQAAFAGPGLPVNALLGDTARLRWAVAGGGASFTTTLSVIGE